MRKFLILIAVIYFVQGCQSQSKKMIERFPNNKIKSEVYYPNRNDTCPTIAVKLLFQ
jgi:hypothetical protein